MQDSMYHSVLRTSALTLALMLMFMSGLVSPVTKHLSTQTERYLASAVGIYAAVEPNGINEVTAALTAKESELRDREALLRERELSLGLGDTTAATNDYTTYVLSVILFVLLVLIVTNYVLDYVRARRVATVPAYGRMG
jgi:hypothetical protein